MNKPRKYFIAYTFWLFAGIKGRINFLQLERFGKRCEQYFRIGFEQEFDFISFNTVLLKYRLSGVLAAAIDPSYISKSDQSIPSVGYFWSGCASKTRWALELCGFAVVDSLPIWLII